MATREAKAMAKPKKSKRSKKAAARAGTRLAGIGGGYADFDHAGFFNDSQDEMFSLEVVDAGDPDITLAEVGDLPSTQAVSIPTLVANQTPAQVVVSAMADDGSTYSDISMLFPPLPVRFVSSVILEVSDDGGGRPRARFWYTVSRPGGVSRDIVKRTDWKPFDPPVPPPPP
jgi:hypothetical protein